MTEQSPAATPTNAAADATSGQPATPAVTPPADPATPAAPAAPATTAITDPAKPGEPATDKPGEAKTDKPAEPVVPEKYELVAPEGFTLEPETTAQFEGVARELKLTNEQANKLVPLAAELVKRNVVLQQEQHKQQVDKWLEEAKTDKEIGGEKFDATVATAKKAVERFATPPLKQLLNQTGLGNHPEVIRLFQRIGTAISEDNAVIAPSAGGSRSHAEVLFDHPTSQPQR